MSILRTIEMLHILITKCASCLWLVSGIMHLTLPFDEITKMKGYLFYLKIKRGRMYFCFGPPISCKPTD